MTRCAWDHRETFREVDGLRLCAMHAADVLFARSVRERGPCFLLGPACHGPTQCAHVVSRRYRATRWDPDNAVPLCATHHLVYTGQPVAWDAALRVHGVDVDAIRAKARSQPPMDPRTVVAVLEVA